MKRIKQKLQLFLKRYSEEDEITWEQAKEKDAILIDVRSEQEYNEGHKAGALCIPHYEMKNKAQTLLKQKDRTIILYCRSGARSKKAHDTLKKLGYTKVYHIKGGLEG